MLRGYILISITHFWLTQVTSLTDSKDSGKFNQGIMLAKLGLITLFVAEIIYYSQNDQ